MPLPFHPLAAADRPDRWHDPSDVPLVAPAVRQAMQDRNFADARKAIDEAAKAKDAPSDYLAYLRAWSLHLEKQHDQAIAALEKFEKDFPQSTWLRRARFAKAQAMVAKGDFRGAQAIYEQEAKYLLSAARRQQSAAVYLEFADARFQPRRQDQQPDYKSAREFYALALDTGLAAPQRAEVEFRIGYCLQKLGSQRRRRWPMKNSSRHMPTTRDRWRPATGWANASWPPAGCPKPARPGGNLAEDGRSVPSHPGTAGSTVATPAGGTRRSGRPQCPDVPSNAA